VQWWPVMLQWPLIFCKQGTVSLTA